MTPEAGGCDATLFSGTSFFVPFSNSTVSVSRGPDFVSRLEAVTGDGAVANGDLQLLARPAAEPHGKSQGVLALRDHTPHAPRGLVAMDDVVTDLDACAGLRCHGCRGDERLTAVFKELAWAKCAPPKSDSRPLTLTAARPVSRFFLLSQRKSERFAPN
jgi:hypothetical protein